MKISAWSGRASGSAARAFALACCVVIAGLAGACAIGPRVPSAPSTEGGGESTLPMPTVAPSATRPRLESSPDAVHKAISVTYDVTTTLLHEDGDHHLFHIEQVQMDADDRFRGEAWWSDRPTLPSEIEIRNGPLRFMETNNNHRNLDRSGPVIGTENEDTEPRSWTAYSRRSHTSLGALSASRLVQYMGEIPWPPRLTDAELDLIRDSEYGSVSPTLRAGSAGWIVSLAVPIHDGQPETLVSVRAAVDQESGLIERYRTEYPPPIGSVTEYVSRPIDYAWTLPERALLPPDLEGRIYASYGSHRLDAVPRVRGDELGELLVALPQDLDSGHEVRASVLVTDRTTYEDGEITQTWYTMQELWRDDLADVVAIVKSDGGPKPFGYLDDAILKRPDADTKQLCCEEPNNIYSCLLVCQITEDRDVQMDGVGEARYVRFDEGLYLQSLSWRADPEATMFLVNAGKRLSENAFMSVAKEYVASLVPASDLLPASAPSPTPVPVERTGIETLALDGLRDDLVVTRVESRLLSRPEVDAWMGWDEEATLDESEPDAADDTDDWFWVVAVEAEGVTGEDTAPIPGGFGSEDPTIYPGFWRLVGARSGALRASGPLRRTEMEGITLDSILALPDADASVLSP